MATNVTDWVWENSCATNGSLLVLLAIAGECKKGGIAEMSVMELARKTRLSDRGARLAVKDLERLGELSVTPRKGGISSYALVTTPADSAGVPRQNLPDPPDCTPAESAGAVDNTPADYAGPEPDNAQLSTPTPADSAGPEPVDNFSDVLIATTGRSRVEVKDVPAKPPRPPERPDIDRLCEHLAARIEANGSKRPNITKKWRDACRLMLDKDSRTERQVKIAIDWSQDHEFWRTVILSMPKLREKYDQLRLQATRQQNGNGRPSHQQETDDHFTRAMQRAKAREEAEANDPDRNSHARPLHQGTVPPAAV